MADQNQNPLISTAPAPEDEQFISPEAFMNATSASDWDALFNRGSSNANESAMSKWERDSLYVKFDPLVASRNHQERMSGIFKAPKPPGPLKAFSTQHNGFSPLPSGNINNANVSVMSLDDSYKTAFQDLTMPLIEEDCVTPSSPVKNGSGDFTETNNSSTYVSLNDSDGGNNTSSPESEKSKQIMELKDVVNPLDEEHESDMKPNKAFEDPTMPFAQEDSVTSVASSSPIRNGSGDCNETNNLSTHDSLNKTAGANTSSPESDESKQILELKDIVNPLDEECETEVKENKASQDLIMPPTEEDIVISVIPSSPIRNGSGNHNETNILSTHENLNETDRHNTSSPESGKSKQMVGLKDIVNPLEEEYEIEMKQSKAFEDPTMPLTEEDSETSVTPISPIRNGSGECNETNNLSTHVSLNETDGGNTSSPESKKSKLIVELKDTVNRLNQEYETKMKQNKELFAKEEMDLIDLVEEYMKAKKNYEKVLLEKQEMANDRDEAKADLRNMEKGFADMLMMYEGIKCCQNDVEHNCETLMKREAMLAGILEGREEKIETCKRHFEEVLGRITQDFEGKIREREAENTKLKAKLRMCDMKIGNIEGEVLQIDRENEKLKILCDDLLKK